MSNYVPEKVFLRGVRYFNMKKTAAENHRVLVEVYGEHALAERTCQKWFARFKSGDFGLEDEARPGQPKKFKDEELEALLDETNTRKSCRIFGSHSSSHFKTFKTSRIHSKARKLGST